ncbi:MAG: putative OB-fold protein [Myxococcota bacterium]|jgi:uncharacterized OB-fold protein
MTDRPAKMIPDPDGLNADFYQNLADGTLCMRHCEACGVVHHPPKYLCAACGSDDVGWAPLSGRGKIFSWTVTHRPVDPAWAAELPYATVVVEMEEGPRLVGAWRGAGPSVLKLDLPVRAALEKENDHVALIYFSPDV